MNPFPHIREYLDKKDSLQCVPVNDKAPFIHGWQNIEVTDEVIDAWESEFVGRTNGFGVRAGQHNLGWIDIDTDDVMMIHKIDDFMDLPQICSKRGKKGKTIFFRHDGNPKKGKYNIYLKGDRKKPVVEVNFTTGQTVLPPSIHPDTGLPYKWISQSLLEIDLDDLPFIDENKVEHLETILNASSLEEGLKSVPTGITGDGSGKWRTMTSQAARLLHLGFDENSIAKTLVGLDRQLFPGNQFFFSPKIGKDLVSKENDIENAVMWIGTYKSNLMRQDPELRKVLSMSAKMSEAKEIHGEWELPREIRNKKIVMEFPPHLIPDAFKIYCDEHSLQSGLPPETFWVAILSSLSAVVQAKVTIEAMSNFHVHPSLSVMIIAPSGSRKDAVFDAAIEPLMKLVNRDSEKVDANFIEKEKDIVHKIEDLSRKKKKAISENDQPAQEALNKEIILLQSELMNHKKKRPDFIFESGTQEKLYELMQKNQHMGIFIRASEYVLATGAMNKKGNESLRGFYLKLFNGSTKERFNHQTKTGTNVDIKKVLGCALMGAQTDVIAKDIREMESGRQADGLLQRFFMIAINPEIRRMVDNNKPVNSSRVDNLYALMYDFEGHVHVRWENEEAKNCYIDYDEKLRKEIQFEKSAIKSFRSKYSGKSVQLAYFYELANAAPGRIPTKLTKKSFLLAVEMIEWLSKNLDIIWGNINYNTAQRAAELILAAIKNGGITGKNFQREVIGVTRLPHLDFSLGVDILVEHGYLRRTGDKYEVNPLL